MARLKICIAPKNIPFKCIPTFMNNGQLTPSQTTEILRRLEHSPVRKLGQNFLVDSNIVRKSLELAHVCRGDVVVEVGPGLGTLTGALLGCGAKVFAVEIDKKLFEYLKTDFASSADFNLVNADAVAMPLAALPENVADFKIVANLPYAISTPWLDAVLSSGRLPKMMSLMLQKEAALRFSARNGSGEFSPISIGLGEAYDVLPPHRVSAACFYPRPAVDSMLLALKLRPDAHVFNPRTKELMRKIFSKRRKQIGSIAKNAGDQDSQTLFKWLEAFPEISPERRPETIEPPLWRGLDEIVCEN